ncbi:hypothetical protein [Actinomadura violacea]|uniref:Transcriptional regulator n=1 Tax=Actinomadura violacea TaxID=2819934 RepID=A0ABS3S7T4_9ACTN|nr:hypothetical protein [Actinomadura violacea]MBO2464946.1 hypothetical protein [Actinomadura violacea]
MDVPWTDQGLLRLLEGWPHTMLARRAFIALSGAAVTASAWEWMDAPAPTTIARTAATGGRVSAETITVIDTIVAAAQQMDDQHGAAGAGFVSDQFACVSRLLRQASYDTATGRRLCAALAQLAQTAGFMAYENLQDGAAQRWYLTALHAAHSANDHALAASILALMSNQLAGMPGQTSQALQLSAAAQQAAARAPAAVQALIAARSSLAYAAAGDLSGFQRTRDQSLQALDHAGSHRDKTPRWARYVTRTELDAITGRGMVTLAEHLTGRHQQKLLASATTLLHDRALTSTAAYQRSTLRHLTWLGLAHARAGDLDQAGSAARAAARQAPQITSPRCRHLIGDLRDTLAAHPRRAPALRPLLKDLARVLPPS